LSAREKSFLAFALGTWHR